MTLIDNRLQVAKIRLGYIVSFFLAVLFFVFTFSRFINTTVSWIAAGVALLVFVYFLLIKPEYIYVYIKNNKKLIIRTYNAFPLFRQYKSYELDLANFVGIETKKNLFSSRPFIRFLVKSKKSVGVYPWLSLSVVPKQEYNRFATYINKNVKLKNRIEAL